MTGASSFTGMWFAKALSDDGHEIAAFLKRSESAYEGIRKVRIEELVRETSLIRYGLPFGTPEFIRALEELPSIDLFCHHAADVTDYRSPKFNFAKALEANTNNLTGVLDTLERKGCGKILLTGSVFEQGEGEGSEELEAMSPYGLSKGLTYESFRFFSHKRGLSLGKFVIPNPFGPYEEDRFTSYLMKEWIQGKTPLIKTPEYVRDNVPAPLLAKAYAAFAKSFAQKGGPKKFSPSFYRERQGDFSLRYASEARKRLQLPCDVAFAVQTTFDEPLVRINKEPLDPVQFNFDEAAFFDANALWYQSLYQQDSLCKAP